MFSLRRKWIAFCGWQNRNRTTVFDTSLFRCIQTKQHRFTDLWCVGTSVWKRPEVFCHNMGRHAVRCVRTVSKGLREAFHRNTHQFVS
jgi:hypothetical protein